MFLSVRQVSMHISHLVFDHPSRLCDLQEGGWCEGKKENHLSSTITKDYAINYIWNGMPVCLI
jgi:hypothetical protein